MIESSTVQTKREKGILTCNLGDDEVLIEAQSQYWAPHDLNNQLVHCFVVRIILWKGSMCRVHFMTGKIVTVFKFTGLFDISLKSETLHASVIDPMLFIPVFYMPAKK